jgi:hypothetical protein
MRHGLAELDFGVAGAGVVFLFRRPNIRRRQHGSCDGGERAGADIAPRWIPGHCCFLSLSAAHCAGIAQSAARGKSALSLKSQCA